MRRMLKGLGRYSPRRWIHFNLACVDRARDLIDDERCTHFLEELEVHTADGGRNTLRSFHREEEAVRDAIRHLWRRRDDPLRGARIVAARAVLTANSPSFASSENVAIAFQRRSYIEGLQERRRHCVLLRDIFVNPFRPCVFSSEWRTSTTIALARKMYDSRDFSAMPILADAFQEAECEDDVILTHCRDPKQVHVRGCWIVDLLLGKE